MNIYSQTLDFVTCRHVTTKSNPQKYHQSHQPVQNPPLGGLTLPCCIATTPSMATTSVTTATSAPSPPNRPNSRNSPWTRIRKTGRIRDADRTARKFRHTSTITWLRHKRLWRHDKEAAGVLPLRRLCLKMTSQRSRFRRMTTWSRHKREESSTLVAQCDVINSLMT